MQTCIKGDENRSLQRQTPFFGRDDGLTSDIVGKKKLHQKRGLKMDSDPLTGAEMAKNNQNYVEKKSTSIGLNFVMCCLCAVSVVTSGYNSWNESNFKSKINSLEQRVFYLEERLFENGPLGGNLQRVEEIRNRVIRDLASKNQQHMQRDEPECSCPAGEFKFKKYWIISNSYCWELSRVNLVTFSDLIGQKKAS